MENTASSLRPPIRRSYNWTSQVTHTCSIIKDGVRYAATYSKLDNGEFLAVGFSAPEDTSDIQIDLAEAGHEYLGTHGKETLAHDACEAYLEKHQRGLR